ncbi:MAG: hypothetical protein KJ600_00420 [Nanoarchaeota archaeon]|nr:hypothetical protein [Nanoarchaeota archaeon]MBU1103007.1 hypothetical protein [Nanoarchaeota archaeon]
MSKTIKDLLGNEPWAFEDRALVDTHKEAVSYFNSVCGKSLPPFLDHNTGLILYCEQRGDGKFEVGCKSRWPIPDVS